MNNFFAIAVLLLATFFVSFQADALAQQVDSSDKEEAIDLDSLKEEETKQNDEGSNAQEALLEPTNDEPVEKERHPALMWSALAVLVPVASLLLPMRRTP